MPAVVELVPINLKVGIKVCPTEVLTILPCTTLVTALIEPEVPMNEPAEKPAEERILNPAVAAFKSRLAVLAAVAVANIEEFAAVVSAAVDATLLIIKAEGAADHAVTAVEVEPVCAETAAKPPDESAPSVEKLRSCGACTNTVRPPKPPNIDIVHELDA